MPRPCAARHPEPTRECFLCRQYLDDPKWTAAYDRPAGRVAPSADPAPDCPSLGRELTGPEREAAGLDHVKRWSLCLHPATPLGPNVCPCKGCGPGCSGYPRPEAPPPPAPLSLVEVGPEGLSKGRSGVAFNAGLIRFKGRLLLCYRTDWAGAHCHVAELAEDYSVRRTVVLPQLAHPWASVGREDPRLFTFRGKLHISYIGVERVGKGEIRTSQLYARLSDTLQVEEVFAPEYAHRRSWEKNWSYFEWSGELFCVYSIAPHVILHIQGNKAYPFAETPTVFPWSGGHLRGGAPPVLVGDRYYHWFHGRRDSDFTYNVGLYTFEAKPPFRVLSLTPDPLLWADPANKDGNYCAVTFPQGAVLEGGRWRVAMGWNDRRVKIAEWGEKEIATAVGHSRGSSPGDVVVTAVLTRGRDDFHTGRKVTGQNQTAGELTATEQVDYFRPFLASAERYAARGVVLHDGLAADVTRACPGVRFAAAVGLPDWNAFERRWVAARNYLSAREDIARVWFVDANDLVFVTDPFVWMDAHLRPGQIATGQERVRVGGNDWFEAGVRPLPPEYARLTTEFGDRYGLSCGAWGADRETALAVIDLALARVVEVEKYLKAHPPTEPVCVDMFAFGLTWLDRFADRLVPFAMDGESVINGVPSPLIHDRTKALAAVATS